MPNEDGRDLARRPESPGPVLSPEDSLTPPSAWYVEQEHLKLEQRTVFHDNWTFAAPSQKLGSKGDFVCGELLGEPWIALRDADGGLRAFANSCRHHATRLVRGEGRTDELVCPYHGWTYGLDGRLKRAPGLGRTASFDPATCRLPEFAIVESGPFIFLCASETPAHPGALPTPLLDEIQADDLVWFARKTYELECNWKVFADNYLDGGYHIAHLHRGLSAQLDMKSYRTELFERWSMQRAESAGGDSLNAAAGLPGDRIGVGARYAFLYPNFAINRYGPLMDTNWIRPLSCERTQVVFDFWVERERLQDSEFLHATLEASEEVQLEDIEICREVQRGLRSSHFDRGPYAAVEKAMHHFHRLLESDVFG